MRTELSPARELRLASLERSRARPFSCSCSSEVKCWISVWLFSVFIDFGGPVGVPKQGQNPLPPLPHPCEANILIFFIFALLEYLPLTILSKQQNMQIRMCTKTNKRTRCSSKVNITMCRIPPKLISILGTHFAILLCWTQYWKIAVIGLAPE